jgi:SAM-dependent methyltransferase
MAKRGVNYWPDDACAKAFWDQQHLPPYQELLTDTVRCLQPRFGERWLDLGCGGGQLTAGLWRASGGHVEQIVAVDCAAVNADRIAKLSAKLEPTPQPGQIRFAVGNFSDGLPQFADHTFDGIVSGLAISYAEAWDEAAGRYTDAAYNRLLAETYRVLKPGGKLVFSVNVPYPAFWYVGLKSMGRGFRAARPFQFLLNGLRMLQYGRWLKREARRGRFHYLPLPDILRRLERCGFEQMRCRLSYAGQAYVIAAHRRVAAPALAA